MGSETPGAPINNTGQIIEAISEVMGNGKCCPFRFSYRATAAGAETD